VLLTKWSILDAAKRIKPWLDPTPLVRSRHFSERLGANVYLKIETLQPTHSFKVRGAFNALTQLGPEFRAHGVITASGGNHGLAVAFAARALGVPATIYLPATAPALRAAAIRRFGAKVLLHGDTWDDANVRALEVAAARSLAYIHPFDNEDVMAGQGTIVTELLDQIPKVDLIVASVGGGGLLSGIISAVKAFAPAARVAGVETIGADSMHQSWQAGRIVELVAITSIADTLGARRTQPRQFEIVTKNASEIVTVSDASAIQALIEILREEKLLTEPATSCSVAALIEGKISVRAGENVVIVLCGANVALERVAEWIRAN
jgi:threonine dehydratase